MMIVLGRGRFGLPASRVLTQVRWHGPLTREEISRRTDLSASTVARTIATLAEVRLLRERPDLATGGTVGRPSIPVTIDTDCHATIGCHIGRRTTSISLNDLRGEVLSRTVLPSPETDPRGFARLAARRATALLAQHPSRIALAAGLVAPWDDIALDAHETGLAVQQALGLEVETADHIPAIAAAEYAARPQALTGTTAYLYSRDTIGFAIAHDRPAGTEISRVGHLSHFPIGGSHVCRCGREGCLEAVVSDESVASRAQQENLVPRPDIDLVLRAAGRGVPGADALLLERARALGRISAIVRDMIHPDRMILCGQGFTSYRPAVSVILEEFRATTLLPPIEVSFTRFGTGVQAIAAGNLALRRVYEDPLDAVGQSWVRRTTPHPRPAIG